MTTWKEFMQSWRPANFRRFFAYLVTIVCVTMVELKVNGGLSASGQITILGVSATYFGSVAWDRVSQHKHNGKKNGEDDAG